MDLTFEPTRAAGLRALSDFVPKAGKDYTSKRNYDLPEHPHVSRLSPYVRHRLVTEPEVLTSVLGRYSATTAEKFVQEVFWRSYFKGWMEMRPTVWSAYRADVTRLQDRLATEGGLRKGWEQACTGTTGIAAFDHWAVELVETGYLHNHARMWFASIWTFTLGLPWQLGADFFLRHLLDGDPASNTLGWRWVVGLHTPGKVYVARASNIARYTENRFSPLPRLADDPMPADGTPNPPRGAPPTQQTWDETLPTGLVLTEEDLSPGWLLERGLAPAATAVLLGAADRSPFEVSQGVLDFTLGAVEDTLERYSSRLGARGPLLGATRGAPRQGEIAALVAWAKGAGLAQIVVPYPPVGPAAEGVAALRRALEAEGISLVAPVRPFDLETWPHATHGFFRFKGCIPEVLGGLKGLRAA